MFGLHKNSVAYAATSFASGLMGSVFGFAYIKVFLNRYLIPESWFHTAQVFYMIWNAVNDPLFGYVQDKSDMKCFRSRRHSILYGAPFWTISFLIPWFQWGENGSWIVGLHLFVALSLYDALLTFVLLAQCAAFAEVSTSHEDRLRLVRYSQWASLAGSCSVFVVVNISDNLNNYQAFQMCTVVIAVLAYLLMTYSGRNMRTRYDIDFAMLGSTSLNKSNEKMQLKTSNSIDGKTTNSQGYFALTWQILKNRNFLAFVLTNFCQELERALCSGFSAIIGDALVPTDLISSQVRAAWYGAGFILPQVLLILVMGQVEKYGYFKFIRSSYVFKIVAGTTMYFIGFDQPWKLYVMIFFMISDTVVTSSTFGLFSMPLSDVIDEDLKMNNRSRPLSSMVFATNALVVKPAQSISPMIAVAVLNLYGYEEYKLKTLQDPAQLASLHSVMFGIVCIVPVLLGSMQLFFWSQYRIRNSHMVVPKYVENADS